MENKEFNLSEKIEYKPIDLAVRISYVKEFIKEDTKLIEMYLANQLTKDAFIEAREKIIGDKLNGQGGSEDEK